MTTKQRLRARQKLQKAGLPVPPELEVMGRGWQRGKPHAPKPIILPKYRPNMDKAARFKARKAFIRLGQPIPEWCAAKWTKEPESKTVLTMQEYDKAAAPVWAKFKAVDASGDAWFFETEPKLNNGSWSCADRIGFLGEVLCDDWTKSKRAI